MTFRVTTPPRPFAAHSPLYVPLMSCVGNGEGNAGSPPPPSGGQGSSAGAPGGPHDPSNGNALIDRRVYDRLIALIQPPPTITPTVRLTPNSIAFRGWLQGKEISLKNGRQFTVTYVENYLRSVAVFIDAMGPATWTSTAHFDARRSAAEKVLQTGNEARSLVQGYNASHQAIGLMRGVAEHLRMASELTLFTKNYPRIDDAIIASSLAFDRAVAGVAALVSLHIPTQAAASRTQRTLITALRNEPAFLTLQPLCHEIAQKWAHIERLGVSSR